MNKFIDKHIKKQCININEASLGRIYQHIQKKNISSWGILTSWRAENTSQKNKSNFKELKSKLKDMNLGFILLKAKGQEEDEKGNVVSVTEPSLFIPDITFDQAKLLANKYDQWGFIYSGEETDNKISLVSDKGKTKESLGSFHPNRISDFYSSIKGNSFVFESIVVSNWMEGMYFSSLGNKYDGCVIIGNM